MVCRDDILSYAVEDCIKELYSLVQPSVEWKNFIEENKIYSAAFNIWEEYRNIYNNRDKDPEKWKEVKEKHPNWDETKSITECIGPRPYEFYYLPREIMKDICDSYVHAYKMDSQQELLDTIETLKNYCKKPIVDKYIEGELREDGTRWPGHRGYDHPDNLEKELEKILHNTSTVRMIQDKFFEFLDMAGKFYNWNRDLNTFNMSVYLGPSPNPNKQAVIDNWKKYRNQDISINEEQILKDYYGDEN